MSDNVAVKDAGGTNRTMRATEKTGSIYVPHHITGGKTKVVTTSFTRPNDTNTYAIGDVVCNSTSAPVVMTFDACADGNAGSGVVIGASLVDGANQTLKGLFELWLFDTSPTIDNDNAAWTPTDAELATLVGIIPFSTARIGDATSGIGGNAVYAPDLPVNLPFVTGGSSDDLFGVLVARNAYVPVAQGTFAVRLFVLQD